MSVGAEFILLPQIVLLALFIVGVVRSAGIPRILLAIWVVIYFATIVLRLLLPYLLPPTQGVQAWIPTVLDAVGSILLAVVLILGRPGYHEDQPGASRPGYPPAPNAGHAPTGPYVAPRR